ncbi:hypothetical protein WS88_05680 [Burkholderia cepacia]|nr:hypothetical protein WS88_05680 [Burkholderia cepacia]
MGVPGGYSESGAYVLGIGEGAQAWLRLVAAGHGVVQHRLALLPAVDKQAIAVDQPMTVGLVLEGVEEAFLTQNALDEIVAGVAGLHAIFARQVLGGDALLVVQRLIVCLEHGRRDLGHAQGLEDAPIGGQLQARQARLDYGRITGTSKPRVALHETRHCAMNVTHRLATLPDREQAVVIEHLAEVDGGVGAGQFYLQVEGLGQALVQGELHHLERFVASGEGEAQVSSINHEHSLPARYRTGGLHAELSDRRKRRSRG